MWTQCLQYATMIVVVLRLRMIAEYAQMVIVGMKLIVIKIA